MDSIMEQKINEIKTSIAEQKETILKVRLVEIGIFVDVEKQKHRRFKLLTSTVDHVGNETYYYDNGSAQGKRIVTFKKPIIKDLKVSIDFF